MRLACIPRTILLLLATTVAAFARPAAAQYKGAIVLDAASGTVLFSDNADEISPPASMAKLMTYAVVDDQIRAGKLGLQTRLVVTRDDAKVGAQRDSTSVWLKTGETFVVEDLIYAAMIQSANDAAYMLAHAATPSVQEFVGLMNAKARALGMTRSTFRTPNGFPVVSHRIADGDLTTPHDFALLCRYLVTHTEILKYTSVKSRPFGFGKRFPPTMMANHNHLLGRVQGVDGLKTGFTNGAGFCLSTTAQRGGRRIVLVMMGCPDAHGRDLAVTRLLDRAFATPLPVRPLISEPTPSQGTAPLTAPTRPNGAPPPIHFTVPGVTS